MGTKERVQRLWAQQTITARDVYDAFPLSCPVVFGAQEQPHLFYDTMADFYPGWSFLALERLDPPVLRENLADHHYRQLLIERERALHPMMTVAYERMLDAAYGPFMAQARLNAAWLERAAKQVLG